MRDTFHVIVTEVTIILHISQRYMSDWPNTFVRSVLVSLWSWPALLAETFCWQDHQDVEKLHSSATSWTNKVSIWTNACNVLWLLYTGPTTNHNKFSAVFRSSIHCKGSETGTTDYSFWTGYWSIASYSAVLCHLVLTACQLPLIRLCGEMHCGSPGGVFPKITLTIDALSIPLHILNFLFFFHHFFCFSEDKNQIVKRYVYSGTSGAASLQQFIEQNIYHRQGTVNFVS